MQEDVSALKSVEQPNYESRIDELYNILSDFRLDFKTTNTKLTEDVKSLRTTLSEYEIPDELAYEETPVDLLERNRALNILWEDNPDLLKYLSEDEEILEAELIEEPLPVKNPHTVLKPVLTKTIINRFDKRKLGNIATGRGIDVAGKTKKEIQADLRAYLESEE